MRWGKRIQWEKWRCANGWHKELKQKQRVLIFLAKAQSENLKRGKKLKKREGGGEREWERETIRSRELSPESTMEHDPHTHSHKTTMRGCSVTHGWGLKKRGEKGDSEFLVIFLRCWSVQYFPLNEEPTMYTKPKFILSSPRTEGPALEQHLLPSEGPAGTYKEGELIGHWMDRFGSHISLRLQKKMMKIPPKIGVKQKLAK